MENKSPFGQEGTYFNLLSKIKLLDNYINFIKKISCFI